MVFKAVCLCEITEGVSTGIKVVHGLRGDHQSGDEGGTNGLRRKRQIGGKPE